MAVRRMVHAMGYRFRLHRKDLPGKPDLVFPGLGKVIFVHGCFWHQHPQCREGRLPKSRPEYWEPKLNKNRERDRSSVSALQEAGWGVLVIWECEISKVSDLTQKLSSFLGEYPSNA